MKLIDYLKSNGVFVPKKKHHKGWCSFYEEMESTCDCGCHEANFMHDRWADIEVTENKGNHEEMCGIHDGPCYVCGEQTSSYAADPSIWSIFLAHIDGQKKHRYYHIKCLYPILKNGEVKELNRENIGSLLRTFFEYDPAEGYMYTCATLDRIIDTICSLQPTVKQPKGGYYGTHCHICHEAVKDCGCVKLMSEEEIENIIDYCIVQREYGEERPAKFIAHAIREAMIRGGEE